MQKLKRMLTEGPLSRQLPAAFALVPSAVVLASLSSKPLVAALSSFILHSLLAYALASMVKKPRTWTSKLCLMAWGSMPEPFSGALRAASTDPHNEHRPADDALKDALNQSGLLKKLAELSMVMASAAPLLRGTGMSGSSKKR